MKLLRTVCLLALLAVFSPGLHAQTTYYVDDDFNSSTPGWGTTHFAAIANAISSAASGDIIDVAAGTYTGGLLLGSKSITLRGPNYQTDGNGTRVAEAVLAAYVRIDGSNTIVVEGFHVDGRNANPAQNTCSWCMRGFLLGNTSATSNVTIRNNIIQQWTTGISLAGGGSAGWVNNVVIDGNKLISASIGSTENATNLTVTNNTFESAGVAFADGSSVVAFTGNTFGGSTSGRYLSVGPLVTFDMAAAFQNNTFDKAVTSSAISPTWYDRAVFASIGSAITASSAGATLTVAAGTYAEGLTIGNSITLLGPNAAISPNNGSRVAEAILQPVNAAGVLTNAPSISFSMSGFTVDMALAPGKHVVSQTTKANNAYTFEHNIYKNHDGNSSSGAWLMNGSSPGLSFTLHDNYFTDNAVSNGISIWDTNPILVDIRDNVWENNEGWALNLNHTQGYIANNILRDTEATGDREWYEHQLGIVLAGAGHNCIVSGNTFSELYLGVQLYDNYDGITVIEDNTFDGSREYSIRMRERLPNDNGDLTEVVVRRNSFLNHADTVIAVKNDRALISQTLNAVNNYWGAGTGPAHASNMAGLGAAITDAVTYSPWYGAAYGTTPMTWGTNSSISAAITAAAAGDIIYVGAGTYAGPLTVSKSLTLHGAQYGVPGAGRTGSEAMITGALTISAQNSTLDGFTVQNGSSGVYVSADNVIIQNNRLVGPGAQTTGNSAITTPGNKQNLTIHANYIKEWYRGMYLNPTITGVSITENTFEDLGYSAIICDAMVGGLISDNIITNTTYQGMQIAAGGDLQILRNTITNANQINEADRGGIRLYATTYTDTVLISENTISGSRNGVAIRDGAIVSGVILLRNNNLGGNASYGVYNGAASGTIDARYNSWGDNSGPNHPTSNSTGSGSAVDDNVTYRPWVGQTTVEPSPTPMPITIPVGDPEVPTVVLNFTTVPPGGGSVNVTTYDTPPAGITPPAPGESASKFIELTTTMENRSFNLWVTLEVSTGPGGFLTAAADTMTKRLAYFNETAGRWVLVSGGFYKGIDQNTDFTTTGTAEFTFNVNHFTVFAFIGGAAADYFNTSTTAYPVYLAKAPGTATELLDAANRTVYPNSTWAGAYEPTPGNPVANDWSLSQAQPFNVFVVPGADAQFGAADFTIEWTTGVLAQTVTSSYTDEGSYVGMFSTERGYSSNRQTSNLGATNKLSFSAARLDNGNFGPLSGQTAIDENSFMAKLGFTLNRPGSTTVDFISADFRRYEAPTFKYAYVEPLSVAVKAYLGDVHNGTDETSGDGKIDINDLGIWSAAYWSGVTGFSGGLTNYKAKFDVGPTIDKTPFTLPVVDTKIDFEDLVIFAISYGLSASNSLPKQAVETGSVSLTLGDAVVVGNETRIPVRMTGASNELRALRLRFADMGGRFIGVTNGALLDGRTNPVPVFSLVNGSDLTVDLAVLGRDEAAITGSGDLVWLRFEGTPSVRLASADARTGGNASVRVALADAVPTGITLDRNYPNPFNPSTTIRFSLDEATTIDLGVYTMLGQRVATLVSGEALAGSQQVTWNGTDDAGNALPSGMYIYRLSARGTSQQHTMMLAK